jgi:hypothetical protein
LQIIWKIFDSWYSFVDPAHKWINEAQIKIQDKMKSLNETESLKSEFIYFEKLFLCYSGWVFQSFSQITLLTSVHGNVTALASLMRLVLPLKPAQSPSVLGVEIQPNTSLSNRLYDLDHVQFPSILIAPNAIRSGFSRSV